MAWVAVEDQLLQAQRALAAVEDHRLLALQAQRVVEDHRLLALQAQSALAVVEDHRLLALEAQRAVGGHPALQRASRVEAPTGSLQQQQVTPRLSAQLLQPQSPRELRRQ